MLKDTFINSASAFYKESSTITKFWKEIPVAYQNKRRHYHNLGHLENMLSEMYRVKSEIADWETMTMALVYHDIVYKATASDNEEKSAEISTSRLRDLRFPDD